MTDSPPNLPPENKQTPTPPNPLQPTKLEVQLPGKIPETWVQQIKDATKPGLISTILGSSILAALIAMGSALLTANMANKGAEQLEKVKLELQAKNEQFKKRVQAYSILAQDLDGLSSSLDTYLRMLRLAAKVHSAAVSADNVSAQRNKVGQAEKAVLIAEKDVATFDPGLIKNDVDPCLAQLNEALSKDEKDPQASSSLGPTLEQLKTVVSDVNREMNNVVAKSPTG